MPVKKPLRSIKHKTRVARRQRRNQRRVQQGKLPLALPLEIASAAERNAAFKQGRMIFYDGNKKIVLPLCLKSSRGDA